jgi:hypothetical protein
MLLLKQFISLITQDREKIHEEFVNKSEGNRPLRIHLSSVDVRILLKVKGKEVPVQAIQAHKGCSVAPLVLIFGSR